MTLSAIIQGCQKQRRKEQRLLFEKYSTAIYAVTMRYMNDNYAAENVTSETFIKCFKAIATFNFINEAAFWAWLKKIAVNECLAVIRKKKLIIEEIDEESHQNISKIENNALAQLDIQPIMELIADLPEGYRTVFNLFAIEGFSHKEIADSLQISEATSRSQFYKARKQLITHLEKEAYE